MGITNLLFSSFLEEILGRGEDLGGGRLLLLRGRHILRLEACRCGLNRKQVSNKLSLAMVKRLTHIGLILFPVFDLVQHLLKPGHGLETVRSLLVLLYFTNDSRDLSSLIEVDKTFVSHVVLVTVLDEGEICEIHAQIGDARRVDAVQVVSELNHHSDQITG